MKNLLPFFLRFLLIVGSLSLLYLFYSRNGIGAFKENLKYSVLGVISVIGIVIFFALVVKYSKK